MDLANKDIITTLFCNKPQEGGMITSKVPQCQLIDKIRKLIEFNKLQCSNNTII